MENTEVQNSYEEVELLESTLKDSPGWSLVKTKQTKKSSNPEDIEIYNMYYNSELNKSIKIIKNPFTKECTMSNVEVKTIN